MKADIKALDDLISVCEDSMMDKFRPKAEAEVEVEPTAEPVVNTEVAETATTDDADLAAWYESIGEGE